jgi:asparagine synthase (glutamine-hydrolysing)
MAAEKEWLGRSPINPSFARTHRVGERAREQGQRYGFAPQADHRQRCLTALTLQDLGVFDTAFRARYGVDARSPAADTRMVEFCFALPEEQFMYRGEPRALIRRAMRNALPPCVVANRQRGMQAADWFERLTRLRDRLPAEMARLERSDLASRVLDLPRLRRMVEQWPDGRGGNQRRSDYQLGLERGLVVGRFLIWFAGNA